MKKLKTVIFELSYAHLEIPHNGVHFWKHGVYLKYYGVNAFDRNTYFKDKLIYLSSPDIYSRLLVNHYITGKESFGLNKYGIDTTNDNGFFKKVKYNPDIINKATLNIRTKELPTVFKTNVAFFINMIEEATKKGLQVIVITAPLNSSYLKARNPNILRRRDSVLTMVEKNYKNLKVFRKEEDTINFNLKDFKNHNHLNPTGAKKLSKLLNTFINTNFPH